MRVINADGRWWWRKGGWQPLGEGASTEEPPAVVSAPQPRFTPGSYDRSTAAPPKGIAGRLNRLSRGLIDLGPSASELRRRRCIDAARTPAAEPPLHVAVASAKGGVGKSTMALLLASKLALLRTDRIIAVECNPHHGTFRSRIRTRHDRSVKDLIDHLDGSGLERDADLTLPALRHFTSHVPESRLEVITAPTDPKFRQALSAGDYQRVFRVLGRYFDIIVLDLGTGLLDDTTRYILEKLCDQLVVVAPAELDGAELGAFTLEFVADSRGTGWLRERAVVVINRVAGDTQVDVAGMETYFRSSVRTCLRMSQDSHLKTGGVFEWNRIGRQAGEEVLAVAAELGSGFVLGPSNAA